MVDRKTYAEDRRTAEAMNAWAEQYHKPERRLPPQLRWAIVTVVVLVLGGLGYWWREQARIEQERVTTAARAAQCQERAPSKQEFVIQMTVGPGIRNPQAERMIAAMKDVKPGLSPAEVVHTFGDPNYTQALVSKDGTAYEGCQWVYVLEGGAQTGHFEEKDTILIVFDAEDKAVEATRKTVAPES